ncbi:transposable element Tcb2 transposase [Trichonephila clavipes]|uniref:Transposable element Tcb2 transposase n=1 Tax=Trichonephila clavipes TaxID=2585209 RepID=A0A8X6VXS5_TRICX|nr:transposable element Tcb2 transposase [Trichonephila clavipes]
MFSAVREVYGRPEHLSSSTLSLPSLMRRYRLKAYVSDNVSQPYTCFKISCLAEGHIGSWRPLRVLPLTPTHRRLHLEWCRTPGNWTAAEWNQVIFRDESRFNLSSDDNRVRVWRLRGDRLNPVFAIQRHTTHTAGVMNSRCKLFSNGYLIPTYRPRAFSSSDWREKMSKPNDHFINGHSQPTTAIVRRIALAENSMSLIIDAKKVGCARDRL